MRAGGAGSLGTRAGARRRRTGVNDGDCVSGRAAFAAHVRLVVRPEMEGGRAFLQDYPGVGTVEHKEMPETVKDETRPRSGMDEKCSNVSDR